MQSAEAFRHGSGVALAAFRLACDMSVPSLVACAIGAAMAAATSARVMRWILRIICRSFSFRDRRVRFAGMGQGWGAGGLATSAGLPNRAAYLSSARLLGRIAREAVFDGVARGGAPGANVQ